MAVPPSHPPNPFSLSFGLEETHVLITGGCGLIGRVIVDAFLAAGAHISVLDLPSAISILPVQRLGNLRFYAADISDATSIDQAFTQAEKQFGPVEVCLAVASKDLSVLPQSDGGICESDPEVFLDVMRTNVFGTYLTVRRWAQGIREAVKDPVKMAKLRNVNCVIMGSESGRFGVASMPAYAAGKSAVQGGLLQSLAKDIPKILRAARVNAVAPGAVDTERFKEECERYGARWRWEESEATVPMGKAVPPEDVARMFLVLASERFSGNVHGQVINVDGGKTGSLVWGEGEVENSSAG